MQRFNKNKFLTEMVELLNYFVDINVTSWNELNEIFTDFVALVHSCMSKRALLVPASRKKRKLLQKPWITRGILVSIRHKQKLYTSHNLHGSELQKRFCKTYANKLTKIKRLSKKLELRSQILNSRHDNKKFWSIMNTLTPQTVARKSPNSIFVGGKIINNHVEIAEKFNSHFCCISKKLSDSIGTTKAPKFNVYLSKRVSFSMYFRPISIVEVFNTINQLKSNKSCGFDGIETKFVKIAVEIIALVLTNLYNHCFALGFFSSCLKTAKVIPAFKFGEFQKLTNYSPIFLLSSFSKILEKLVHSRTVDFINSHHILTPTQYGLRSNHSTIHAILDIITSTYDNIESQVFTGLVLLDLAKAFDTVDHDILLQKLHHYGIREIANNFFSIFSEKPNSTSIYS